MSGGITNLRYHGRPSSARRHGRDDNHARIADNDQRAHSTTHRHHSSSSRNSPRKHYATTPQGMRQYQSEDYILEDDVPPLRRQSTQPPRRRTSPISHPLVANRDAEEAVFQRRGVKPRNSRQPSTPHAHHSSRQSSPVNPPLTTALVVVDQVPSNRHSDRPSAQVSPRRSARASPRRSHSENHNLAENGIMRSPRQHISPRRSSPRRAHRQGATPIRPERRTESPSHHRRHHSTEPRTRSPHSSSRRHRELHSARATPDRASEPSAQRHSARRHRSLPVEEDNKHRSSSWHSRRHSHAADGELEAKRRSSSRRHGSGHRSHGDQPPSRHESERRHRHESRSFTPISVNGDKDSRRARPVSRHYEPSRGSSVAPREPLHMQALKEAVRKSAMLTGSSTYVRPNAGSHVNTRRSSGSGIEVISVNSARTGSPNSWVRLHEVSLPAVVSDPHSEKIMQRIDSTRHWIRQMKEVVEKDRERELQAKREAETEDERNRREEAAPPPLQQQESGRVHRESHRARKKNGSTHHHRSSSRGSQRRTRSSHGGTNRSAGAPALVEPGRAVDSSRHPRAAIAPAAPQERLNLQSASELRRSKPHSTHEPSTSTRTAVSDRAESSSRFEKPVAAAESVPAPAPASPAVLYNTMNSSRQDSFDYPIFSFVSFLDGNTFDSTEGLCQYNTELAESLSDEHLDLIREVIFNHDEEAFAELLYGDDVQAEMDVIAKTLGHSEDPFLQREIVILQRAAVRRFNDKCSAALRTLLAARGGLADAVQVAASQLERQAYVAGVVRGNSA